MALLYTTKLVLKLVHGSPYAIAAYMACCLMQGDRLIQRLARVDGGAQGAKFEAYELLTNQTVSLSQPITMV